MKILLLLLLISQHATAVEVYEGAESVLLPCHLLAAPSEFTAAVWDRKDLNIPTVHVRVKSGDDVDDQNQRYTNRTSMSADALQTGNLSLTLRNPTVSDNGTYTCILRITGRDVSWTYLQLKVTGQRCRQRTSSSTSSSLAQSSLSCLGSCGCPGYLLWYRHVLWI
ncbi:butyrophilin-like protein 10 isoform X2 [Oreochromis aureus]|uniref:butyrophilin-like protein 10 isoform X2 n=1 Tax=Oreochromis aureus TaxID=47969 RepID=UPI0019538CF1|nr:butyrophilin-like protein 10 isoform X2 [Oreochromis aureus]